MLIICKSCKKLVDTNKHDFCPKCGSNFNYGENLTVVTNTADYEEYERRMAEQQRNAVENRMNNPRELTKKETQKRLRKQADKAQGKKNGCAGCAGLIVLVIFGLGVISGIIEEGDIDFDELFTDEYRTEAQMTTPVISIDVPDYVDVESSDVDYTYPLFVLPKETAYTDNYSFVCTEVAEYENEFFPAGEGYKYISFTFELENTTDTERFYYNSPTCVADGNDAESVAFGGIFLPGRLAPGGTYRSSVVFKVPEYALFYDIYYGDDVVVYASISDIEGYEDYWEQWEEQ